MTSTEQEQRTAPVPVTKVADTSSHTQAIPNEEARRRWPAWWLWIAILCALSMGAVVLTRSWRAHSNPRTTYTTGVVDRGVVTRSVTATGTVNPVLNIIVGSYVSGVIQSISCDFNTKVVKDQLCAKIDPRPYQTVVDQDRASVATAKAQLVKDQATLNYADLTFSRQSELDQQGVTSKDALDSATSSRDALRAQVALDRAAIDQREAELRTSEVNLSYTDIRSPVNGMVVQRNVTIGQTVAASFQTPTLFLIATDLTDMQVDTNVSESDLGFLREKDEAQFTVESFPNRVFHGSVVQVRQAPQSIQNVVTYDVVVGVTNKDFALKPGMTATVRIITGESSDTLRVPAQALRYAPSGIKRSRDANDKEPKTPTVWVLRNGTPRSVAVRVGLEGDSFVEVSSDELHASDAVVLSEKSTSSSNAPSLGLRL